MRRVGGWWGAAAVFAAGVAVACTGGGRAVQTPVPEFPTTTAPGIRMGNDVGEPIYVGPDGVPVTRAPVSRPAPDIHRAGEVIPEADTWAPFEDTVPCVDCPPVPARISPPETGTHTVACLIDGTWRGCGAVSH